MKRDAVCGFLLASFIPFLFACGDSELTLQKEEELRQSRVELEQVKRENEEFRAAKKKEEQKLQGCATAFRNFEKAQAAKDPGSAVALYREGLNLCPDDDVAHYELGKIFAGMGKRDEARAEFEAALKINPNFQGAKQEMEKVQKK